MSITLELPELRDNIDGRVDVVTYTTLIVSFLKWSQLDVGGAPPTEWVLVDIKYYSNIKLGR